MILNYKRKAIDDLLGLKEYICKEFQNEALADDLMRDITKRISMLKDNPLVGRALKSRLDTDLDLYYFVVSKQIVFYQINVKKETVSVVRVLDSRRDYLAVLSDELFD